MDNMNDIDPFDLSNLEFEFKYALAPNSKELFLEGLAYAIEHYHHKLQNSDPTIKEHKHLYVPNFATLKEQTLQNTYFDTDQKDLFYRYHAGLRLRRSSSFKGVEQTLKMKGGSNGLSHEHLEFNVRQEQNLTTPDLSLFRHLPIDQSLLQDFGKLALKAKYATDFVRNTIEINLAHAGRFELAIDLGQVRALDHVSVISEVEFELKELDLPFFTDPSKAKYNLNAVKASLTHTLNSIIALINLYLITHYEKNVQVYEVKSLANISNLFQDESLFNQATAIIKQRASVGLNFDLDLLGKEQWAVVSLEPFSKLKRALDLFNYQNQKESNLIPRAKVASILQIVEKRQVDSSYEIISLKQDITVLTNVLNDALGFARLFKTKEHMQDLLDCVKGIERIYYKFSSQEPKQSDPLVELLEKEHCSYLAKLYTFSNLNSCLHKVYLATKALIKDLQNALAYIEKTNNSLEAHEQQKLVSQVLEYTLYRAGSGLSFFIILETASNLSYFLIEYEALKAHFDLEQALATNSIAQAYYQDNIENRSLLETNWFVSGI